MMTLQFWLGVMIGFTGLLMIELMCSVAFVAWSLKMQAQEKAQALGRREARAATSLDVDADKY